MTQLFIANSTKQNYDFRFRLPEDLKIHQKLIPYGSQVALDQKDLTPELIDYILNQHAGDTHDYIVKADSVDRAKGHIGLIYSIDKPVSSDLIANTIAKNDDELNKAAELFRKEAALAMDKKLEDEGLATEQISSEVVQEVNGAVKFEEAIAQGVNVAKPSKKK